MRWTIGPAVAVVVVLVMPLSACSGARYVSDRHDRAQPVGKHIDQGGADRALVEVGEPTALEVNGAQVDVVVRTPAAHRKTTQLRLRWATEKPGVGKQQDLEPGVLEGRLGDLPAGRVWIEVIAVRADDRDGVAMLWLDMPASTRRTVTVDFDRGGTLTGRLVYPDGRPVADREVVFDVAPIEGLDGASYYARTDACGCFRFEGLGSEVGTLVIQRDQPTSRAPQVVYIQFEIVEGVKAGARCPIRVVLHPFDERAPQGFGMAG